MIEVAKDGIQQIATTGKEQLATRLSNPVVGPFLFSWAFCNYRIFFVLFSNDPLKERFSAVDSLSTPLKDYLLGRGLAIPLAITLGYIILVPMIMERVLLWNLWMQRRQKAAEQRSEGLELLTKAESEQLRAVRVEKDRQLNEISQRLAVVNAKMAGWKAMVKGADSENGAKSDEALVAFLLSQEFAVYEANVIANPLAILNFYDGNSAYCSDINSAYARHVDRWGFKDGILTLTNADGELTGKLAFLPDRGQLSGEIRGDLVDLRGRVFKCD